jgi:hypothetical protein
MELMFWLFTASTSYPFRLVPLIYSNRSSSYPIPRHSKKSSIVRAVKVLEAVGFADLPSRYFLKSGHRRIAAKAGGKRHADTGWILRSLQWCASTRPRLLLVFRRKSQTHRTQTRTLRRHLVNRLRLAPFLTRATRNMTFLTEVKC